VQLDMLARLTSTCLLAAPALTQSYDGLALFQAGNSTTTRLMDSAGNYVMSWPGSATPGLSCYLDSDGDLVRALRTAMGGPGIGGRVERLSWDGALEWTFDYVGPEYAQHHDIEVLPNGNVLMIVWDYYSGQDALDQGRDPAITGADFAPDRIIEVEQTGPTSGQIVWQWRAWDHLVQDLDPGKPNHGVVADEPGKININYPPSLTGAAGDWLHINGIDYNPELDQIVLSVPEFKELWIIDHSTTTAEAATDTGGNSGRGGELLYRWGNPHAYDRGSLADRRLFGLHDAQWVEPGSPGEGNLLVFNNGNGRPTSDYSSIDELTPPTPAANGTYPLGAGVPFGPSALTWTYENPGTFYSMVMGGCERLPNGNTLVIESTSGELFEVEPDGTIVWFNDQAGQIFKSRLHPNCFAGQVYCAAEPNSAGAGATLSTTGSTDLSLNDLTLLAQGLPPAQFGVFFHGESEASITFGDGTLCIGPPHLRLNPPVPSDGAGSAAYPVDNTTLPGGPFPLLQTTRFQFWYRDPAAAGAGWNLSEGLALAFCP